MDSKVSTYNDVTCVDWCDTRTTTPKNPRDVQMKVQESRKQEG